MYMYIYIYIYICTYTYTYAIHIHMYMYIYCLFLKAIINSCMYSTCTCVCASFVELSELVILCLQNFAVQYYTHTCTCTLCAPAVTVDLEPIIARC